MLGQAHRGVTWGTVLWAQCRWIAQATQRPPHPCGLGCLRIAINADFSDSLRGPHPHGQSVFWPFTSTGRAFPAWREMGQGPGTESGAAGHSVCSGHGEIPQTRVDTYLSGSGGHKSRAEGQLSRCLLSSGPPSLCPRGRDRAPGSRSSYRDTGPMGLGPPPPDTVTLGSERRV